jgi:fatty acid elongase 3
VSSLSEVQKMSSILNYIESFEFTDTNYMVPLYGTATYLASIFVLKTVLRGAPGMELKWAFAAHNAFLCALSLLMLVGVTLGVYRHYAAHGSLFDVYCDERHEMNRGPVWFWVYVFYLSKYYEFADTLFLVLRQKPLLFLHVYHHASTVVVAYLGLYDNASYCWIACFQNCFVHVLMYYYYCASTFGYSPWWKRYLTMLQIGQFWINMLGLVSFAALRLSGIYCAGTWMTWVLSFTINATFYILFQLFFNEAYKKDSKKSKQT